jgi:hypothetical protein
MIATFQDIEDDSNPLTGTVLRSADDVHLLFDSIMKGLTTRRPYSFELRDDGGRMLTIGIAPDAGCVQFSSSNGALPYLMAVSNNVTDEGGFIEFLAGGTPTPMPKCHCLPVELVEKIVVDFVLQGKRSGNVHWVEI